MKKEKTMGLTFVKEVSSFFKALYECSVNYEKTLLSKISGVPPDDLGDQEKDPNDRKEKTSKRSKRESPKVPSPYILFFRDRVKSLNKSKSQKKMDGKKLSQLVAEEWKGMSETGKAKYLEQYHQIKLEGNVDQARSTQGEDNKEDGVINMLPVIERSILNESLSDRQEITSRPKKSKVKNDTDRLLTMNDDPLKTKKISKRNK